jgi:hypothetical protein
MSEIGFKIEEPLIERETLENALEKCRDVILEAEDGGLARFSWPLVRSSVADAVAQSASGDKVHWLLQGWAFAKELQSYKDAEKYPPDETAVLKLGEHELSGTFNPVVTISCEGKVVCKLTFELFLSGAFNAVSISIRNGRITACGGGECALTMTLKFRDVDLTGPLSLKKFALPGKVEFPNPIKIP